MIHAIVSWDDAATLRLMDFKMVHPHDETTMLSFFNKEVSLYASMSADTSFDLESCSTPERAKKMAGDLASPCNWGVRKDLA